MNRRSFLQLSLGTPLVASQAINGGLGLLAKSLSVKEGILQSLQRWSIKYPDRLLCIPYTVFEPLWDYMYRSKQLYGSVDLAREGWDHLFFSCRPVIPYWSKYDLQHTAKEVHDSSGKWIVAIEDSQL